MRGENHLHILFDYVRPSFLITIDVEDWFQVDITVAKVAGFRAPNFSVDDRLLELIRDCGYRYDSSCNSFSP